MGKYVYGFDIGGTTIKIGLFDTIGNLLKKTEIRTNLNEKGKYILLDIFNEIRKNDVDLTDVLGYGFGVPGPVHDGIIIECVNIGWENYDLKSEFSKYTLNDSIYVENDANVATLGETINGAAIGYINSAMITVGTGVGGGIIVNSKIVGGSHGAAGEIGHMQVVRENGIMCNCGKKGCLETIASATGIKREYIKLLKMNNVVIKNDYIQKSAKKIFGLAKKGNPIALEVVDNVAYYIGYACHILSITTNPDIIVIGGGVSKAGDFLIKRIENNFKKINYSPTINTKIVLAKLGNEAGIYGAASLVISND